ncbi:MAG: hypothetical protein GY795_33065 [Desulfobacterales bacterium]|nr:hypothetical protein [Desulfobacterales bacterium]
MNVNDIIKLTKLSHEEHFTVREHQVRLREHFENLVKADVHPLYPLLPLFLEPLSAHEPVTLIELYTRKREPKYDRRNLTDGLAGTEIVCPETDDKLLKTYFSYFIDSGFFPCPS